jgi:hypothetical protein
LSFDHARDANGSLLARESEPPSFERTRSTTEIGAVAEPPGIRVSDEERERAASEIPEHLGLLRFFRAGDPAWLGTLYRMSLEAVSAGGKGRFLITGSSARGRRAEHR